MRKETSNQFTEGLVSDLNPINTPKTVLTDSLNGTIITYNGNEFSLQNDRGNYELKNCRLKPNYIPVGLKEHGDILYIVSYNPLDEHVEIGSYPSPLRINSSDSDEYNLGFDSIIKTEIIDKDKTEGNYSELVKSEQQLIFNGDDYKLYPGDQYKISEESECYGYEAVEYFIIDDSSNLHDITEDVKKHLKEKINFDDFSYVSWLVPGWIVSKIRLAQLSSSEINIRAFYAPTIGDTKTAVFNLNFKANSEDYIVNDRINKLQDEFQFKIDITYKNGREPKTELIKQKSISNWYLNNHVIWSSLQGQLEGLDSTEVVTISTTPVLSEYDKNGDLIYSIVYDNLKQTETFDLSKVNDTLFTVEDTSYRYYIDSKDKTKQTIEVKVDGAKVTSSKVNMSYEIYDLNGKNVAKGDFETYEGIGNNKLTIPFSGLFEKENVYKIKFIFKADENDGLFIGSNQTKLLITTELLDESVVEVDNYETDVIKYIVNKYLNNITFDWNSAVSDNIESNVIVEDEILKPIFTDSLYNTFVEEFVNVEDKVLLKDELSFNVNTSDVKPTYPVKGPLWNNICEFTYKYNDSKLSDVSLNKGKNTIVTYDKIEANFQFKKAHSDFKFTTSKLKSFEESTFLEEPKGIPELELTLTNDGRYRYYFNGRHTLGFDDSSDNNELDIVTRFDGTEYTTWDDLLNKPFEYIKQQWGKEAKLAFLPFYKLKLQWNKNITFLADIYRKEEENNFVSNMIVFPKYSAVTSANEEYLLNTLKEYMFLCDRDAHSVDVDSICGTLYANKDVIINRKFITTISFNPRWYEKVGIQIENIEDVTNTVEMIHQHSINLDRLNELVSENRANLQHKTWTDSTLYTKLLEFGDKYTLYGAYPPKDKKDQLKDLTNALDQAIREEVEERPFETTLGTELLFDVFINGERNEVRLGKYIKVNETSS